MINSNVTTLILNGTEMVVQFSTGYPYFWITNKGDSDIFVSLKPNISPETNGTYTIVAGETARIGEGYRFDTFYILGTGKAYIRGEQTAFPTSFKQGARGGDGGTDAADFTVSFDKTNNLLKNTTTYSEFNSEIVGEDIIYTIPANLAVAKWIRFVYGLSLEANCMYMLVAKNGYNGFGRLGISNEIDTAPWGVDTGKFTGNHALGFFPAWKKNFCDWDTHAIEYGFDYCYFYLQKKSHYDIMTIPFEIWFCGDLLYNETREEFRIDLALYKQKNP